MPWNLNGWPPRPVHADADTNKRDYILGYCEQMRVEQHRIFRRDIVDAAWPEQSIEALRANSLTV